MNRFLLAQVISFSAALPCLAASTCGTSSDPAEVVQAQVDAYNRHDLEGFLSCYAENATLNWLDGHRAPVKGLKAFQDFYGFLEKIPAARAGYGVDILMKTVTGPTIPNVEHVRGLSAKAKPEPDNLVIYEVREGKILNVWFAPSK